jgi:hypothetical protein
VSGFFKKQHVNVQQGLDLVRLKISTHKIDLYYQTAFAISRAMRMEAKGAMSYEKTAVKLWRELANYERQPSALPMNPFYRRSDGVSNLNEWAVKGKGPLVIVELNELTAKLHYADALIIQSWIRVAATEAKRWAGDRSKGLYAVAHLTDAENNYRLGLQ